MKIGSEVLAIRPETKRALDIEILLWNLVVITVVLVYAFDLISLPAFFVLFYLAYGRFFIGNHDRMHTDTSRRAPRFLEVISETFQLGVVPWVEPYDSVRNKHMSHHASHRPGKTPVLDTHSDPQGLYEHGGFLRSLLSSMFYEEVQLVFDIRNGTLTRSRWINLIVYLPLEILFVVAFGWQTFLVVAATTRLLGGFFWFLFSWVFHTPQLYHFGLKNQVPPPLQWVVGLANGTRTMHGMFRHATHHAWPRVPSGKLDGFDSAVLRNPAAAPNMIPSG